MKGLLRFCWQCVSRVVCSWIGFSYHVSNVSSVLDMNNAIFCPPRVEAQNFASPHAFVVAFFCKSIYRDAKFCVSTGG